MASRSLYNLITGGGYGSYTQAENTLNPLGTANQQMYGQAIGQLMTSPDAYKTTALAGAQQAGANAVMTAGGVSPALEALMSPFVGMLQGTSFNTYLGNLAQLSGATTQGLQAQAQQLVTQGNVAASQVGGIASLMGVAGAYGMNYLNNLGNSPVTNLSNTDFSLNASSPYGVSSQNLALPDSTGSALSSLSATDIGGATYNMPSSLSLPASMGG